MPSRFVKPFSKDLVTIVTQRNTPEDISTISPIKALDDSGSRYCNRDMLLCSLSLSCTYNLMSSIVRSWRHNFGQSSNACSKASKGRLDMHNLTLGFKDICLKSEMISIWSPS